VRVGFIGFGEAGSTIAADYAPRCRAAVRVRHQHAHDVARSLDSAAGAPDGTTLVDSPAALARDSDVLCSTVTSSAALDAARQTAPFLEARHLYADLNSVSPALNSRSIR